MDNNQLKKMSRQGARISLFGFLIIISVFVFAALKLNKLNIQIASKSEELTNLDSTIVDQKADIKELQDEINALKDPSLKPQAYAVLLPNIKDPRTGNQIYDFNIWITSSQYTLNRIESIEYFFEHPTMLLKNRQSKNKSNSFLVSYRGWGCLKSIRAEVKYKNGKTEIVSFDMCEALQW